MHGLSGVGQGPEPGRVHAYLPEQERDSLKDPINREKCNLAFVHC